MAGAPEGNSNSADGKAWKQAVKRALARKSGSTYREGLDLVAEEFVKAACSGEQWAVRELADRIDGKPAQALIGGEEGDPAIKVEQILIKAIDP